MQRCDWATGAAGLGPGGGWAAEGSRSGRGRTATRRERLGRRAPGPERGRAQATSQQHGRRAGARLRPQACRITAPGPAAACPSPATPRGRSVTTFLKSGSERKLLPSRCSLAPVEGEVHVGRDRVGRVVVLERFGLEPPAVRRDDDHIAVGLHRAVLPAIGAALGGQGRPLRALDVVEDHPDLLAARVTWVFS